MGAYFYPRPPRGGRHSSPLLEVILAQFLSTPSARRATSRRAIRSLMGAYFYPRPPRGGRPLATQLASCCCEFLSTPSARRATIPADKDGVRIAISIHALREEGDQGLPLNRTRFEIFLSTPSARRATYHLQPCFRQWGYFYPRPPRGGRLQNGGECCGRVVISIHALREEGDVEVSGSFPPARIFLSTPSARRATSVPFTISAN